MASFPKRPRKRVDWISCFVCLRSHGANESSKADGYIYMHFINAFFQRKETIAHRLDGAAASSDFSVENIEAINPLFQEKVEFKDLKYYDFSLKFIKYSNINIQIKYENFN